MWPVSTNGDKCNIRNSTCKTVLFLGFHLPSPSRSDFFWGTCHLRATEPTLRCSSKASHQHWHHCEKLHHSRPGFRFSARLPQTRYLTHIHTSNPTSEECVGSAFWLAWCGSSQQFQVQLKLSSQLLFGLFYPKPQTPTKTADGFCRQNKSKTLGNSSKSVEEHLTRPVRLVWMICFVQHNLLLNFVLIKHTLSITSQMIFWRLLMTPIKVWTHLKKLYKLKWQSVLVEWCHAFDSTNHWTSAISKMS